MVGNKTAINMSDQKMKKVLGKLKVEQQQSKIEGQKVKEELDDEGNNKAFDFVIERTNRRIKLEIEENKNGESKESVREENEKEAKEASREKRKKIRQRHQEVVTKDGVATLKTS